MAVAGIVGEAVKGAVHEAWTVPNATPVQRAVLFFTLLALIAKGVWGNLTLIRYATYAYWLHSSLRPWKKDVVAAGVPNSKKNALIARNIRYGAAHRSLLDVYVPCKRKLAPPVGGLKPVVEGLKPVVIFIHGGVWASGDKWQFSPLGTFLAEEGLVAVLVQYTLYPEALAIDQVGEVSDALTWTMDNIAQYGGDPSRVTIMGHSSGAHLGAMVLWERARRRAEKAQQQELDKRIPHGFIGLAGVYNIGEHFKYEKWRGVDAVSCMRRANGWEPQFDAMSPSLLFESLLLQKGVKFVKGSDLVPKCLLIASKKDVTVPPSTSFAFHSMLQTLGCDSTLSLHEEMAHEDYCLWHRGWGSLKPHLGSFLEEVFRFVYSEP
jgi:acetyl esterase/lipase